jgi:hypothetical protein
MLLKSPSHTARVRHLLELLGRERVKFVHISRGPVAVVRSNVAMHKRLLELYGLQSPPAPEEIERRAVEEYLESETRYLEDRAKVPAGHLVEVRYEDLVADPVGEMKRVYETLGLGWSDELELEMRRYLARLGEYRAATPPSAAAEAPTGQLAALAPIARWFGHDRPAKAAVQLAPVNEPRQTRARLAWALALVMAVLGAATWTGLALATHNRLDWVVWPVGVGVGWGAITLARVGTLGLGIYAAALTTIVLCIVEFATTYLIYQGQTPWTLWEIWDTTSREMLSESTLPWEFAGIVSALRYASRKHVHPPGRG